MPKVSVIIPVYNAEKTLVKCIANLVLQTLDDIELIFVNDCSTDHSLDILLEAEKQFSDRVMIINLDENLGPGGARNVGLSYASGEYFGFVDSDDIADTHMFERAYQTAIDTGADMVDMAYYDEENDRLFLQTPDELAGELDDQKRCGLISLGGYLWSRLIKRDLFDDLSFREHAILEDMEVMMQLFLRTKRIATIKDMSYKYSANPDSASKPSNPLKYHSNIMEAMNAVYEATNSYGGYETIRPVVEYSLFHLYQCGLVNILAAQDVIISKDRDSYMKSLYNIRRKVIKGMPRENKYVVIQIDEADIKLIEETDKKFSRV